MDWLHEARGLLVSVPFRGTVFLNLREINRLLWLLMVSVPFRGTVFLNDIRVSVPATVQRFRPLSGNCISKLWQRKYYGFHGTVSVPFRGTVFLNTTINIKEGRCQCFRPLSGNCISKFIENNYFNDFANGFPSPFGELYF